MSDVQFVTSAGEQFNAVFLLSSCSCRNYSSMFVRTPMKGHTSVCTRGAEIPLSRCLSLLCLLFHCSIMFLLFIINYRIYFSSSPHLDPFSRPHYANPLSYSLIALGEEFLSLKSFINVAVELESCLPSYFSSTNETF